MRYDASVVKQELQALFDIKGRADEVREYLAGVARLLPGSPCAFAADGPRTIYFLGRSHWLLRAPLEQEIGLLEELRPDEAAEALSVVLVSDSYAFFEISGADAPDIVSIASPLDIGSRAFPEFGATFTEAFGIKALLARKPGDRGAYELAVDRSYENMVAEYFRRILR